MDSYLNDKAFLQEICAQKNRVVSARITSYTKNDAPIEIITGKVTSGNINLDGNSAVRRSCSLTLLSKNLNIHDYYWGLKTRIKVEIGLNNNTNKYQNMDIIWFPMGYYLISSFSLSLNTTGLTINISGKDKMCLLNGEMGGIINAPTDFGIEDIIDDNNNLTKKSILIKRIITEMVHEWGGEEYYRILINDVDDYGLNLETYRGDAPVYLAIAADGTNQGNRLFKGDEIEQFKVKKPTSNDLINFEDIDSTDLYYWDNPSNEPSKFILYDSKNNKLNNKEYCIQKIKYGQNIGYMLTELVYPGDLMANAGETVTSILDKIKNMLGNYEYFYNIDGNFVFQKQKIYKTINNLVYVNNNSEETSIELLEDYLHNNIDLTLNNLNLITSISNSPQFNNVKNDFTIWGSRKSANGSTVPIHMRFAIDNIPTNDYTTIFIDTERKKILQNKYPEMFKSLQTCEAKTYSKDEFDWRELIYQMALDFRKLHYTDEYRIWLQEANPWCQNGKTGYEQYYIDMEGFWRTLYQTNWENISFNFDNPSKDFLKDLLVYRILSQAELSSLYNDSTDLNPITAFPLQINHQENKVDLEKQFIKQYLPIKKDAYIYGPMKLSNMTLTRQKYGLFQNIVNTNYLILEKYYIAKICEILKQSLNNVSKEFTNEQINTLIKELNQIQENNTLYYYDPNTCIQAESTMKSELNTTITEFIEITNDDLYHPMIYTTNLQGFVEEYKVWDNRINNTSKKIKGFSLFDEPKQWFYKVVNTDENNEKYNTYLSLGTYYPLPAINIDYIPPEEELQKLENSIAKMYFEEFMNKYYANFDWQSINNLRNLISLGNSLQFNVNTLQDMIINPLNYIISYNESNNNTVINNDEEIEIDENNELLQEVINQGTSQLFSYFLIVADFIFLKISEYIASNKALRTEILNLDINSINNLDDFCNNYIFKDWEENETLQSLFNIVELNYEEENIPIEVIYSNNNSGLLDSNNIDNLGINLLDWLKNISITRLKEYFKLGFKGVNDKVFNDYIELKTINNNKNDILQFQNFIKQIQNFIKDRELWKIVSQAQKLYYISDEPLQTEQLNISLNQFFVNISELITDKENDDNLLLKQYKNNLLLLQGDNQLIKPLDAEDLKYQISTSLEVLNGEKILSNNNTDNIYQFIFDSDVFNYLFYNYKLNDIINNFQTSNSIFNKNVYKTITLTNELYDYFKNQNKNDLIKISTDKNLDLILQIIFITISKLLKNKLNELNPNDIINKIYSILLSEYNIYQWPLEFDTNNFWNLNISTNPESLLFWIDFSDNKTETLFGNADLLKYNNLQKYSITNIGRRPIVKNDSNVKAIYYLSTANNILVNKENEDFDFDTYQHSVDYLLKNNAYNGDYQFFIFNDKNNSENIDIWENFDNYFTISTQGKSAAETMENLVYNNGYVAESISISCLPQYFLQPNTRIAIYDDNTKINGIYLINKISIPLGHSGIMNITANKDANRQERNVIFNGNK